MHGVIVRLEVCIKLCRQKSLFPKMKVHFTFITLLILGASHYFSLYFWRRVGSCLVMGVGVSFFSAFVLDVTAFDRIAKKQGLHSIMSLWHVGNVVLHGLPIVICHLFESDIQLVHGAIAGLIHVGWIFLQSGGTMCLDEMYVHMKPCHWQRLWKIALVSELAYSILMSL